MIIGLTGGIASGKSHLAAIFEKHGCAVFDADRTAKACLNDHDVLSYLNNWIGFHPPLDKKELAKHLFSNHKARAGIERIVHPKVHRIMLAFIDVHKFRDIVLDIPLLFEKGIQDFCDLIIFAYSPYNVRAARAKDRGWSLEDFESRQLCQFPVKQKERMSDVVVPTYNDLVDLDAFVRETLRVKK